MVDAGSAVIRLEAENTAKLSIGSTVAVVEGLSLRGSLGFGGLVASSRSIFMDEGTRVTYGLCGIWVLNGA